MFGYTMQSDNMNYFLTASLSRFIVISKTMGLLLNIIIVINTTLQICFRNIHTVCRNFESAILHDYSIDRLHEMVGLLHSYS